MGLGILLFKSFVPLCLCLYQSVRMKRSMNNNVFTHLELPLKTKFKMAYCMMIKSLKAAASCNVNNRLSKQRF